MNRTVVDYEHDPADLSPIYLSVSTQPVTPGEWKAAYRDTIDGRLVVWARFPDDAGPYVWLRDRRGGRRVDNSLT